MDGLKIEIDMDRLRCITSEFIRITEAKDVDIETIKLDITENEILITPIARTCKIVLKRNY